MRPRYDFSKGVRGKYAGKVAKVKVIVTEFEREEGWGCSQHIVERHEFATRELAEQFVAEHNAKECPPLNPGQRVPDLYYKASIVEEKL